MRQRNAVLSIILILALVTLVAGCKKNQPDVVPDAPAPTEKTTPPPPPPRPAPPPDDTFPPLDPDPVLTSSEIAEQMNRSLRTIYFAFDSADLSESARSTLRHNAATMQAHPEVTVVVGGHCDERGTIEYNLALGERRAASVRDYLVNLGANRSKVRIITYGEERPAAPGHSESAWSQNRRAEFKAES